MHLEMIRTYLKAQLAVFCHLRGGGVVGVAAHASVVVGASQFDVYEFVAVAVSENDGAAAVAGFPPVSPLHRRNNGENQVVALLGEPVLAAFTLAGFAVGLLKYAVLDDGGETLGPLHS
jgi:hypothetical protein